MKVEDLIATNGGKPPVRKPCCDPRLPVHYQKANADSHLGAVEPERWKEDENRLYDPFEAGSGYGSFGFFLPHRGLGGIEREL